MKYASENSNADVVSEADSPRQMAGSVVLSQYERPVVEDLSIQSTEGKAIDLLEVIVVGPGS